MRQLLLRPVIFVTLLMSVLVFGELLAIARLTWLNQQRLETIETDIGKGHRLEETIFELLQLQSRLAKHKNDPSASDQADDVQERLMTLLQNHPNKDFNVDLDLKKLQTAFARAIDGDSQALIDTVDLIQNVLDQQTDEEEKLLINIEDDSRLELQLAMLLPFLLFLIGRYFFRTNVTEPLDALRDLLSGLAEGVKQPINRDDINDPVLRDLFDRYNRLVAHLIRLEHEHVNHTAQLESQVRQTSHALLEQSRRLARAERLAALTEMAASTAHELRNPLAVIQVAMENLLSEVNDPDLKSRIGMLHREVQRLTQHLNDLLSSARGSSELIQQVNIHQAIGELMTLLHYQAGENIRFKLAGDSQVIIEAPETELRQVLLNLLQNAAQAIGDKAGEIEVDVQRQGQHVNISVSDDGGGFSDAFLDRGIRPFVSLKEKGSGLGLAMVQRFVRDQHGSLKLENPTPGRARVTLSLPLTAA